MSSGTPKDQTACHQRCLQGIAPIQMEGIFSSLLLSYTFFFNSSVHPWSSGKIQTFQSCERGLSPEPVNRQIDRAFRDSIFLGTTQRLFKLSISMRLFYFPWSISKKIVRLLFRFLVPVERYRPIPSGEA